MTRQYLACEFTPGGRRYTYHNDGEPFSVGDRVVVDGKNGEAKIIVAEIVAEPPPFDTKPIKGLAPAEDESKGDAAA